jgi:Ca-activated chloride channel family protein
MSAAFERLTGLVLQDALLGALAAGALLGLGLWRLRRRHVARVAAPPLACPRAVTAEGPLPVSWRARLTPLAGLLAASGLVLLVIALARPSARADAPDPVAGIDLVLALDVSSSMSARDALGGRTRLEEATLAARRFVARRAGDRIGLIAFARTPELLCPPTRDHAALLEQLAGLASLASDSDEDATALGAAAALAAETLGPDRGHARVAIVLSDGEENVALASAQGEIAPAHAAQWAERLGVRLHVIATGAAPSSAGVGGAGGSGGEAGAPDLGPVRTMAERTGGRLFEAGLARTVDEVYTAIDALERAPRPEARVVLVDRHAPFLAWGLALLWLARVLAAGPLGRVA